jgi:prevent-host-death family protein
MDVSVVELRRRTKEVLAVIDRGGSVTITYRGKPRAVVGPVTRDRKPGRRPIRDYPAFGMWKDREDMRDVEAYVRSLRRDRLDALR